MKTCLSVICLLVLALSAPPGRAATNANDVASNYAGRNTYLNITGGTGWANAFTNSNGSPSAFLASSPQIDTATLSFGLSGGAITRTFGPATAGGGVLNADQSFQFRLRPGSVPQGAVTV